MPVKAPLPETVPVNVLAPAKETTPLFTTSPFTVLLIRLIWPSLVSPPSNESVLLIALISAPATLVTAWVKVSASAIVLIVPPAALCVEPRRACAGDLALVGERADAVDHGSRAEQFQAEAAREAFNGYDSLCLVFNHNTPHDDFHCFQRAADIHPFAQRIRCTGWRHSGPCDKGDDAEALIREPRDATRLHLVHQVFIRGLDVHGGLRTRVPNSAGMSGTKSTSPSI